MKIFFWAYNFFIFVHTFQWTSSESFFYFRFSNRKSQSQQKLAKKITHCTIQLCTLIVQYKKPHLFYEPQLTWYWKQYAPTTQPKTFDFTTFPANMFLFGVIKDICTTVFLDAQEPHSWSTLKPNVCIFPYISVRTCLFQRRSKILLLELDWWEAE